MRRIIRKLFPDFTGTGELQISETRENDDARCPARLILSAVVIYNADKVERGLRDNNFFDVLKDVIEEGRSYFDSRVPFRVRRDTEIFNETLQQFVQMKREDLERIRTGTK